MLVYACTQQSFSSRKIAKALRDNIHYMWLSGMSQPDHRIINRFRGVVLKEVVEEVFYGIVEQLFELGYVDLEKYFVDGTKIEANANRCSFVWKKSRDKYKANLQEKVRKLLDDIEEIEAEEEARYGDKDYPEVGEGKTINKEALQKTADKISEKFRKDPQNKKLKKAYRQENFTYLQEKDQYLCPQGKVLSYQFTKDVPSYNGYQSTRRVYGCADCEGCPVKTDCTKSKYNRRIYIGVELQEMRKTARGLLTSPEGVKMRPQRPIEVEAVYGRLKGNWGFRRFLNTHPFSSNFTH